METTLTLAVKKQKFTICRLMFPNYRTGTIYRSRKFRFNSLPHARFQRKQLQRTQRKHTQMKYPLVVFVPHHTPHSHLIHSELEAKKFSTGASLLLILFYIFFSLFSLKSSVWLTLAMTTSGMPGHLNLHAGDSDGTPHNYT